MGPLDILTFWFGQDRKAWFEKDPRFDEQIRARFLALYEQAVARELDEWQRAPKSCLALVILLDQLSRNLYRGDARAFAQDAHALECASQALSRGDDLELLPVQRTFLYLPYKHSESLADQDRAVDLMRSLDAFGETRGMSDYAVRHRDVVRRFGRFPHRNAALGRRSTAEELAFIATPGSGF